MATLQEKFKEAILEADWNGVCEIYTFITKEKISPPKPKKVEVFNVEDLANLEMEDENFVFDEETGIFGGPSEEYLVDDDEEEDESNHQDDEDLILYSHQCQACNELFAFEDDTKPRKKCPKCGKHKLIKYVEETEFFPAEETSKKKEHNEFHIEHNTEQAERENEDGTKPTKKIPFNPKKKMIGYGGVIDKPWQDDLSEHTDELKSVNQTLKTLYGKQKKKVAPPRTSLMNVVCRKCNKKEKVSAIIGFKYKANPEENLYVCNDCLSSKGK